MTADAHGMLHSSGLTYLASEAALLALCATVPATSVLWLSAQYRITQTRQPKRPSGKEWEGRRALGVGELLLLPFLGGAKHLCFQVAAWALWIFACAGTIPVFFADDYETLNDYVPASHHQVVLGAAVVCGILGEVLLLKSFLVFQQPACVSGSGKVAGRRRQASFAAAVAVVVSGAMLSALAVSLMSFLETLPDPPSQVVFTVLAGACILVAASCTHGLAGDLLHGDDIGSWQFFQPGVGGTVFILAQGCGWLLFSLALLGLVSLTRAILQGMASFVPPALYIGTGVLMVAGQIVLGGSLFTFQTSPKEGVEKKAAFQAVPSCGFTGHLLVASLYLPVHLFCGVVVLSFVALPPTVSVCGWVALLIPYYCLTSWDEPAHTGRREWEAYRTWMSRRVQGAMDFWVGGMTVTRVSSKALSPDNKYVFGYHPHALFPTGAAYLSAVPSFQELLPGIQPATLVASMLFLAPVLRDLAAWGGLRKVNKKTFIHALDSKKSVLLCPGGQAELVDAYRAHTPQKEVVINSRHRGFVRLALQQGAALVPILVFGELFSLRNLFDWPSFQQWTYKLLGFPVPYLIVGRGLTPLPCKQPVEFVIGDPLARDPSRTGAVTEEEVEEMHGRYFNTLATMFEEHKGKHERYKDAKLVLSQA